MFEDKRYQPAGPTGGPGVLGPWKASTGGVTPHYRHATKPGRGSIWNRIKGRARALSHTGRTT